MGSRLFLSSYAMLRQSFVQTRGFATSNVAVEGFSGSVGNTPLVKSQQKKAVLFL